MPSVKVALENLPDGAEVEIPYLGSFENNTQTEVEQWKWDRFIEFSPTGQALPEGTDFYEVSTAKQREVTQAHQQEQEQQEPEQDHRDQQAAGTDTGTYAGLASAQGESTTEQDDTGLEA